MGGGSGRERAGREEGVDTNLMAEQCAAIVKAVDNGLVVTERCPVSAADESHSYVNRDAGHRNPPPPPPSLCSSFLKRTQRCSPSAGQAYKCFVVARCDS